MRPAAPVIKDLVLIGGGHSHIAVLRSFGMRPLPGVRVTLISRDTLTPYSGMLPGVIAGLHTKDEALIDLVPLCQFSAARFIKDEVIGLDPKARRILFRNRPAIPYDILSINCGSTPTSAGVSDADNALIPVKPIDQFFARWNALLTRLNAAAGHVDSEPQNSAPRGNGPNNLGPTRIAVVGGGVGGVELVLAASNRLHTRAQLDVSFELVTAGADILTSHGPRIRRRLGRLLADRGISVRTNARVTGYIDQRLKTAAGLEIEADEVLWTTNAAAPQWISESKLATDQDGFLLVDSCLNSVSDKNVFGAGDAVTMRDSPRPKSGVFAVRQGRPLANNLRRALLEERLVPYKPQREFLRLIGTADGSAVAVRGAWITEGRWVWHWKTWIDRRFMRRFQTLPEMDPISVEQPVPRVLAQHIDSPADGMRCGGCGAKVGADVLNAALAEISSSKRDDIVVGLEAPDDAAIVAFDGKKLAVFSIDAFRPMIDDPFLFGQITANHCLNDLYAMGAEAQTAMTIATLPVWPDNKLAAELQQMLAGAVRVFDSAGATLIGGHTSEGTELSLGFSVTGLISREAVLHKSGLRPGDRLILTKAIGTGAIFAANMRAKAKGVWVDEALSSMLQSNRSASECLRAHNTSACTDVTGFGLLGHGLEMLRDTPLFITLDLDSIPALPGAAELSAAGFRSTLQPKNKQSAGRAIKSAIATDHPLFDLLFDPQTAGGLLAGVAADNVADCLSALRRAGYTESAVIGVVGTRAESDPLIRFGKIDR
jgi:selenide,water dikinase